MFVMLAHRLKDAQIDLFESHNFINMKEENKILCVLQEWLRYQALWDLQPDQLYERLGTDLGKWMKTLVEIK